jgi:hypothetical protein
MSDIPLIVSTLFGLVIFGSIMLAVLNYQDELDTLERVILAGFAGSMLLTTPALWMVGTPFDGWSFNLSRGCLTAYCVKRFFVPVLLKWRYDRRHRDQVSQSAARMHDRRRHWL